MIYLVPSLEKEGGMSELLHSKRTDVSSVSTSGIPEVGIKWKKILTMHTKETEGQSHRRPQWEYFDYADQGPRRAFY